MGSRKHKRKAAVEPRSIHDMPLGRALVLLFALGIFALVTGIAVLMR